MLFNKTISISLMQIMKEGQQLGYLFEIGLGIVSSDCCRFVLTLSQSWGVISSCAIKQTISEEVNRKWWVAKGEFFFLSNQESTFLITRQKAWRRKWRGEEHRQESDWFSCRSQREASGGEILTRLSPIFSHLPTQLTDSPEPSRRTGKAAGRQV